jgi:pimeloyl-ACP methyl ester carboxylesterase
MYALRCPECGEKLRWCGTPGDWVCPRSVPPLGTGGVAPGHAIPERVWNEGDDAEALLAAGELDAVVETLFRDLESMSDADLRALRAAPSWPGRVAAARTLTRECRAERGAKLDPEQAATIAAPVLLLTGEHSADPSKTDIEAVAAALPDARILVLEGQEHVADILAPETFAHPVLAFLRES